MHTLISRSLANSQLAVIFVSLILSISNSYAAKSIETSTPLEAVSTDKARVYIGVGNKTLSDKWLYDWDVTKLKLNWFGGQNRFYTFK